MPMPSTKKGALRRPAKRFCCVCLVGFKQRPLDFTTKTWEQNCLVDYTGFKKNAGYNDYAHRNHQILLDDFKASQCQPSLRVAEAPYLWRISARYCVGRGFFVVFLGWPCVAY